MDKRSLYIVLVAAVIALVLIVGVKYDLIEEEYTVGGTRYFKQIN